MPGKKARALGVKNICIHKGLPFGRRSYTADISTTGSLVEAHNTGFNAAAITAGGVLFDAAETDFFFASANGNNFAGSNPVNSTGDPNFDAILNSASFVNGTFEQTFTIDGLIDGNSYLAQFFVLDSRGAGGTGSSRGLITIGDGISGMLTSTRLFDGFAFTGTFAAVGTTQIITVQGDLFALMNAWQLRNTTAAAVPEPSTLAMFAFGLAGLGFMGWRRRRAK